MEIYFPRTFVSQDQLEIYGEVSTGKYTTGLGQDRMAFCTDLEDINSVCLTVLSKLLEGYKIDPMSIGRLEVGTETIIDKSKSVKSTLMRLFTDHGNHNIEGVDSKNACYGGTAALFNSIAWIESSLWDGRNAIVVAGDIAVYSKGPARPTGGAGAVAILLGPEAPIVFEPCIRWSFMADVYDFYKPNMDSEYPMVDGALSIQTYMEALERCYDGSIKRSKENKILSIRDFGYFVFHSPYSKLVQKAFSKLCMIESIEAAAVDLMFVDKVAPSQLCSKELGNLYCGSVYAGLLSLLCTVDESKLANQLIGMFSYGSGVTASFFALRIREKVQHIKDRVHLQKRLNDRIQMSPAEFEKATEAREFVGKASTAPRASPEDLLAGTFYLQHVDSQFRRFYLKRT